MISRSGNSVGRTFQLEDFHYGISRSVNMFPESFCSCQSDKIRSDWTTWKDASSRLACSNIFRYQSFWTGRMDRIDGLRVFRQAQRVGKNSPCRARRSTPPLTVRPLRNFTSLHTSRVIMLNHNDANRASQAIDGSGSSVGRTFQAQDLYSLPFHTVEAAGGLLQMSARHTRSERTTWKDASSSLVCSMDSSF